MILGEIVKVGVIEGDLVHVFHVVGVTVTVYVTYDVPLDVMVNIGVSEFSEVREGDELVEGEDVLVPDKLEDPV